MKKRAQFYLIAAAVIIAVIVGFILIRNSASSSKSGAKIYDLSEELEVETGSVYDYGVYNEKETDKLIENWTEKYFQYSKTQQVEDWIFVYGDRRELDAITFSVVSSGTVGIIIGGTTTNIDIKKDVISKSIIQNPAGKVDIKFQNFTYSFDLKQGENLFFIIKSQGYVARS